MLTLEIKWYITFQCCPANSIIMKKTLLVPKYCINCSTTNFEEGPTMDHPYTLSSVKDTAADIYLCPLMTGNFSCRDRRCSRFCIEVDVLVLNYA